MHVLPLKGHAHSQAPFPADIVRIATATFPIRLSTSQRSFLSTSSRERFLPALDGFSTITTIPTFFLRLPCNTPFEMAPTKKSSTKDTYSVILPTFNERQNLPIITWLLQRTFTEK